MFALYGLEIAPPDPEDVLPREKCEDALRAVRQARWFEVILHHINNGVSSKLSSISELWDVSCHMGSYSYHILRRPTAVLTDIRTLLSANRKIQEIFYTVLC